MTRSSTEYEFKTDSGLSGSTLDRSIFRRNDMVQQRFNVSINTHPVEGDWGKHEPFITTIRNESMNPTAGYSLISGHSLAIAPLTAEGIAVDFSTMPNIDLNKIWWSQEFIEESKIYGQNVYLIGDLTVTLYEYLDVLFFNETLFNNLFNNQELDLYDIVEDGEWTWEKYKELALQYGTGETDTGAEPTYGAIINKHSWMGTMIALDAKIATKDPDTGRHIVPDVPSDKYLKMINDMTDFYNKDNILGSLANHGTQQNTQNPIFSSGRALFYGQTLDAAKTLRGTMSDQYGIIPLPKYDEFQEKYYSSCRDSLSAVTVLKSVPENRREMVGTITEALCMESYKQVRPSYYELAIKMQYAGTSQRSSEMIDIIRAGLTFDGAFNWLYDRITEMGGNPYDSTGQNVIMSNGSKQVYALYMSKAPIWQRLLADVYTKFDKSLSN